MREAKRGKNIHRKSGGTGGVNIMFRELRVRLKEEKTYTGNLEGQVV